MLVGIQDEIVRFHAMGLLKSLLTDKTTKSNLLWATDAYRELGAEYDRDKEIDEALITGPHSDVIKTRARKAMEQQSERTRKHAEVFTPLWVCQRMTSHADAVWFGKADAFLANEKYESEKSEHEFIGHSGYSAERIEFPKRRKWQHYVDSRRLEITCGEAPYLVNRYDVATGESIPIESRTGILDRKLRIVNENTTNEADWLKWALRAYQATYGYEFQGDNLLIARVNLMMTFEEYFHARWKHKPRINEYRKIATVVVWNLWQMDGLTGMIPYCKAAADTQQMCFDPDLQIGQSGEAPSEQPACRIYDWRRQSSLEYRNVNKGGRNMKFDFVIGNPPYQDETLGDNKGFAPPIYHLFMDAAYQVSDKVELIHPARFLFNAGSTPKAWNEKMLSNPHIKVLFYEQNSSAIFQNTDIMGGVAITYYSKNEEFGAIETFASFPELNSIRKKAAPHTESARLMNIIYIQNRFNLNQLYAEHPEYQNIIGSNGRDKRFRNNIFEKIDAFAEEKVSEDDIRVLGILKNKRVWRYIPKRFMELDHENLYSWKVLLPRANGSGAIGEVSSTPLVGEPLVGEPLVGYTQSFIGIGSFSTVDEANAALKYIKSKFARTMLGILKITQDNNRETWKYVPLQDFTSASDIDWSKPVPEIDRQLYAKYGLDEKEIEFIETHVKEMV